MLNEFPAATNALLRRTSI